MVDLVEEVEPLRVAPQLGLGGGGGEIALALEHGIGVAEDRAGERLGRGGRGHRGAALPQHEAALVGELEHVARDQPHRHRH